MSVVSKGISFPKLQLLDMFDHMTWADAEVWKAVESAIAAPTDEQLHRYLAHVHLVQRAFLDAWTGAPPVWREPSQFPDLAAVHAYSAPYYAEARAFLEAMDESLLVDPIILPWSSYMERELGRTINNPTLGETVMQVIMHSGYHRAQANARLRAIGAKPPLVDYIAWIWFGRPSAT